MTSYKIHILLLCLLRNLMEQTLDAEGSSQIILPTQNLETAYYFDKESKAVF